MHQLFEIPASYPTISSTKKKEMDIDFNEHFAVTFALNLNVFEWAL